MSFREKSAWITLVTVLICFGAYFGALVTGRISGHGLASLHLLLIRMWSESDRPASGAGSCCGRYNAQGQPCGA